MSTKLVVVEDEKNIRQTICDYFEDCGWITSGFPSGEEAFEFLKTEGVDYIIVDGRLPGMSGSDFIVKSHSLHPGMKYIIHTGSYDFEINDELRAAGITEKNIVMKPLIGFSILHNALEQIKIE